MTNTWIVIPVKDNQTDASEIVSNLTGGFVAPEKYEIKKLNPETKELETEEVDHPHFGENAPDFTNKVIFVNFEAGFTSHDGVVHLADNGDVNIYRAWNTGIDHAVANGADSVVLLNSLTDFDPFTVVEAKAALDESDAEIVNISDGGMLLVSGTSDVRADEQFRIWFGDNDLYKVNADKVVRSAKLFGKFSHIENWDGFEGFDAIVKADEDKYEAKHG
jgi:hypothetical protein